MKKRVLIVDDEKEIVDFLKSFLGRFNIHAETVTNGEAAVQSFKDNQPDCTFLDIQLPGKDGIAVLKELTQLDPHAKVIMITGSEEKEYQEEAKKYGALDYITKPLDLHDLKQKIDKYLIS